MRYRIYIRLGRCLRCTDWRGLWGALLLWGSLTCPAAGQSVTGPYFDAGPYMMRAWTAEQGMPQNSANALLQSRNGYLWIATDFGVARFDGVHFQAFNGMNTGGGLPGNVVRALYEDRTGVLWIGTEGGLSRYEAGVFRAFTAEDGLAHPAVDALCADRQGALWIGTRGGLTRYMNGRFVTYGMEDGLPREMIHALHVDRQGTLWAGTESGLFRFDGQAFLRPSGFPSTTVNVIREGRGGTLWFGTGQGLFQHENGTFRHHALDLGGHTIHALYDDRDGLLWLGSGADRLDRYAYREGTLTSYPTGPPGHRGPVWSLLEDREGNLWAGTSGYGLLQVRPKLVTHITVQEGLAHNLVRPILEDRAGAIWIGTRDGYLHRLRDHEITIFGEAEGLRGASVFSLVEDRAGTLWAGTVGLGVARFENGRFVFAPPLDRPRTVQALFADHRNRLWVGTDGQGVYRLSGDTLTHFTTGDGLPHSTIRAITEAPPGTLWLGTDGGLARYRNGAFQAFTEADGLSHDAVTGLTVDLDEDDLTLWIGTAGGGVTRYRNGTFSTCAMPMNPVDDGRGYLWTHGGTRLYRVSKQELHACADGLLPDVVEVQVFGKEAGLQGEANSGFQPAAWRSRDGRLWFPTTMGAAVVDPGRIEPNTVPPPVVIEQVLVGKTPVVPDEALVLKPGQNQLTIQYTGLSFAVPERVRFRYRLDDLDDDWVQAGTRRIAYYTHVPPGTYTFLVQAANNDGLWNETPASLPITIRPYFYQTRHFYVLCLLIVGALGVGAYRLRVHRLKAQEQVLRRLVKERTQDLVAEKRKTEEQARRLAELDALKSRFFANVSHEFRTPLTLIIGPLQDLLNGAFGPASPTIHRQHQLMLKQARRLLHLINQLLDLSKLESGRMDVRLQPGDLVVFLHDLVQSFVPLAERRRITLAYQPERETLPARFDADKLEKVFSNLLANALKFTPEGGKVWVTLNERMDEGGASSRRTWVEVVVKDTGPGIPKKVLPHIFDRFTSVRRAARPGTAAPSSGTGIGLALAHEMVELHGGQILVESEEGFGTAFFVRLPLLSVEEGAQAAPRRATGSIEERSDPAYVEETDREPAALPPPRTASDATAKQKPTILVVEDSAEMRAYLRRHLADDYRVVEAADGAAGLELARSVRPDLILSDVMMSGMDGVALCRAVKQDDRVRDVPVVLLTARAGQHDAVEGLTAGADDYVAKPFSTEELRARVAGLIATRQELRRRFSREVLVQPSEIAVQPDEAAFLEQVLETVEAHMAESPFNVDALANEVGLSRRQLTRKLKAVADRTPAALIRHMRLERAARLLQGGAGTVAEVAYRVGFQSPSHFARAFRKAYGTSPSAYAHDET